MHDACEFCSADIALVKPRGETEEKRGKHGQISIVLLFSKVCNVGKAGDAVSMQNAV